MGTHAVTIELKARVLGRWRLKAGLVLLRLAFWLMRGYRIETTINGKRTRSYQVVSTVRVSAEVTEPCRSAPA